MCKNGCMSLMTMDRIMFYILKHFAVYQILPHVILTTVLEWLDRAGINIPILQMEKLRLLPAMGPSSEAKKHQEQDQNQNSGLGPRARIILSVLIFIRSMWPRLAPASVMMGPSFWVSISLRCDVVCLFGGGLWFRVRSRVEQESLKSLQTHMINAKKLAEGTLATCYKQNKPVIATQVSSFLIYSLSFPLLSSPTCSTHTHAHQEMQYGSGIQGSPMSCSSDREHNEV